MGEKSSQEPRLETQEYAEYFRTLAIIKEVLSECGLNAREYSDEIIIEQLKNRYTFPIAHDGLDGIRASRNREGGLTVSFTNGFEDPENKKRIEVTAALREKGIRSV
ncbi:MAG: hypothetical protein WC052_00405 [Patescibacteria group bacterium]|jgi:hypothetical protein